MEVVEAVEVVEGSGGRVVEGGQWEESGEDQWRSFGACPRLMLTQGSGTDPRTQSRSPGTSHLVHDSMPLPSPLR